MTVWGNGGGTKPSVSASGKFGAPRPGGRTHAGADFIGYRDLKAIESGVVTLAGRFNAAAGNAVAIDLPDPVDGCTVTIVRMHIADSSIKVSVGDRVSAGQLIGTMGSTGNAEGDCDHVEIRFWKNGVLQKTVDPEIWIAGRTSSVAGVQAGVATRHAKATSNGRSEPRTSAPVMIKVPAGFDGTFDGFTHGEKVEGNDVWFHGAISHRWFWSGAYTDPSPTGLKKL